MFEMSQHDSILKERVRAFWQQNPCGTKFADAPPGSRRFYELVEEHRYKKEWHIPAAAGFAGAKDLSVLEVVVAWELMAPSLPKPERNTPVSTSHTLPSTWQNDALNCSTCQGLSVLPMQND
jgi:hypothetical protein